MKKQQTSKSFAKNILFGGLYLALTGFTSPNFENTDCYKKNEVDSKSQTISSSLKGGSSLKKDKPRDVLIVLSPHFDDAVLSVGGILSEFDGQKYVVSFFSTPKITSQYLTDWDEMSGFDRSTDARAARTNENENATNLLGAKAINLDYIDNQYQTRSASDISSLTTAITGDIEEILESMNNDHVTIIGPSYFGEEFTHPDHRVISTAFMRAIKNKCYTDAKFYLYEDLPYTHRRFGDEEITLDAILEDFYSGLKLNKRQISISPAAFALKMQALKLYTSQIKAFASTEDDIVKEVTDFGMKRSLQSPLPAAPCEVIYEIQ